MNRIMITGANGQLGMELRALASAYPSFDFIFLSRKDLPVDDGVKIRALFETIRPVCCVNCAAYTAVDKAETEKDQAYLVNGEAVGLLAAACKTFQTRLIHISTDYVFEGNCNFPLKESDPTGPLNVYGASKLLGEQLAMQQNAETVIIRTSWVYSEFGNNFVKTMIRLMREKESLRVIDDQVGSPTYAGDLAGAIGQIACGPIFVPGIFHYSDMGQISWYEFAMAIRQLIGSSCRIDPIPGSQYPTAAQRPHFSLLDKGLIQKTYGLAIPGWKESLMRCIKKLQAVTPT
jgi:dTDP-4-dehydrorhamnose reductase